MTDAATDGTLVLDIYPTEPEVGVDLGLALGTILGLLDYGAHRPDCAQGWASYCTCGWDQVRRDANRLVDPGD